MEMRGERGMNSPLQKYSYPLDLFTFCLVTPIHFNAFYWGFTWYKEVWVLRSFYILSSEKCVSLFYSCSLFVWVTFYNQRQKLLPILLLRKAQAQPDWMENVCEQHFSSLIPQIIKGMLFWTVIGSFEHIIMVWSKLFHYRLVGLSGQPHTDQKWLDGN